MDRPMPASPQKTSSMAIGIVRPVGSPSMALVTKSTEYNPILAASCTTGQGNSSFSSHSSAAGRMTSLANWCSQSLSCSWSSLSASEKSPMTGTTFRGWSTPAGVRRWGGSRRLLPGGNYGKC